eukprot:UN25023
MRRHMRLVHQAKQLKKTKKKEEKNVIDIEEPSMKKNKRKRSGQHTSSKKKKRFVQKIDRAFTQQEIRTVLLATSEEILNRVNRDPFSAAEVNLGRFHEIASPQKTRLKIMESFRFQYLNILMLIQCNQHKLD